MRIARRTLMLGGLAATGAARAASPTAPLAPSPTLRRCVGDYGPAEPLTVVGEDGGRLMLFTEGAPAVRLSALGAQGWRSEDGRAVVFGGGTPLASAMTLDGVRLPRRDIGAEAQATIRAGVRTDLLRLRAEALAAHPPTEPPPARASDLVSLSSVAPGVRFDIRYAGRDNFMGVPLYERAGAYMQRPAAEALARVQRGLAREGLGLLVFDAYRPWFVTRMFWDATPPAGHVFVADPQQGSRHNRGCAVDLTLCDLATGAPVEMTSRYDEMSRRAYPDYPGGTTRQRWFRQRLRRAMEAEGFTVFPQEWWHFDFADWRSYAIGTKTFTELEAARSQERRASP